MSLVMYGGGILDNRGSVGGNTFSRSKFGATMRAKTSPINIVNARTTSARTTLQYVTGLWSSLLTEPERQAWNAFALLNPQTNIFGQVSYLSGMGWFTKLSVNLQNVGATIQTAPPISGTYPPISTLSLAVVHGAVGSFTLTYTEPALTGTPTMQVWATPNLSAGTSFVSSQLRFMTYCATNASPIDLEFFWHRRFGGVPLLQGQKVFILCANMNEDDGTTSAGLLASAIIS